jgi:hypothetical protein
VKPFKRRKVLRKIPGGLVSPADYFEIIVGLLSFGSIPPKDCVDWLTARGVDTDTSVALVRAGMTVLEKGHVEV